jgi:hypothetical protein
MSVLPAARTRTSEEGPVAKSVPPLVHLEVPAAPNVITEHEVVLSTAAAVPLTHWRTAATPVVAIATGAAGVASRSDLYPPRHYPPRLDFLETSRMEREMHRL